MCTYSNFYELLLPNAEIHMVYKEVAKRKVKFLDSSYGYLCVLFKYLHLHKSKHRVFLKDQYYVVIFLRGMMLLISKYKIFIRFIIR